MIGIVVIDYHDHERTARFVREECAKIAEPHTVEVVLNEETGSPELSALLEGVPGVHVTVAGGNIGFARGNNLGFEALMQRAAPDKILFSNNDISFTDPAVADTLSAVLDGHPGAGMAGPAIIGPDGHNQSPRPFESFWNRHVALYWSTLFMCRRKRTARFNLDYSDKASEGFHYLVSGAFFMVRSAEFGKVGMMDPGTFLYAEEAILSERYGSLGLKAWYCPRVKVLHEHGTTTAKHFDAVRRRRMKFESEVYYYRKYIGLNRFELWAARLTYWLKDRLGR